MNGLYSSVINKFLTNMKIKILIFATQNLLNYEL